MKIERTFTDSQSFLNLFMPLIDAEIDKNMEQQDDINYNDDNANTSHSEGVA